MTIGDLRCDICGRFLAGPADGVRFVFHPGVAELRDDSGLACVSCWGEFERGLPTPPGITCAVCGGQAPALRSLHVRRFDQPGYWRLCSPHAVAFLNSLRTVAPKLDVDTFRFPGDDPRSG